MTTARQLVQLQDVLLRQPDDQVAGVVPADGVGQVVGAHLPERAASSQVARTADTGSELTRAA